PQLRHYKAFMQLPLQNFRKNVHKSLIHMETASPKMRNRHFGVELGRAGFKGDGPACGRTALRCSTRSGGCGTRPLQGLKQSSPSPWLRQGAT
ncbi:hypothetical protein, partial [Aquabacterium parvum]|uniref:hypothetical protein n=1 Tax=Aquabacterium parvum TaxID=70584 RepID=UPI001F2C6F7D